MTYSEAASAAKDAEKWASVIPSGGGDPWIYNLSQSLIHLSRSQRLLAEQLEADRNA